MLIVIADVHVGNHNRFGGPKTAGVNERAKVVLDTLARVRTYAKQHDATLIIAGDLFDHDDPSPQLITATRQALPDKVSLIPGNHDQHSTDEFDNALGPLYEAGCNLFHRPTCRRISDFNVVFVPYAPGDASEVIGQACEDLLDPDDPGWTEAHRVLVFHAGIRDSKTPWFLQKSKDAVDVDWLFKLADRFGFRYVFAGNWHDHRTWDNGRTTIMQVGSLAPTGFDDLSELHGMAVLSQNEEDGVHALKFVEVPGPRFCKVKSEEEARAAIARMPKGSKPFLEWCGTAEGLDAFESAIRLDDVLIAKSGFVDYTGDAREAAATVAEARGSIDEAVTAYVNGLELPEDIQAADVVDRALRYLKR